MTIATTTQFWTTRWNGGDPLQASSYFGQDNTQFQLEASSNTGIGSEVNGSWFIDTVNPPPLPAPQFSVQKYQVFTDNLSDEITVVASFSYDNSFIPDDNTILLVVETNTHQITIRSDGTTDKLKIGREPIGGDGGITLTSGGLDLAQQGSFEAKPIMIRVSINSAGKAKIYINEVIEDDIGVSQVIEVDAVDSSLLGRSVRWGVAMNTSGAGNMKITYHNIYASTHGAFSPDELSTSPFVSDMLMRMAFSIVELLRNSKRFYLKNMIDDSSILYGYDVSSGMVSRLAPPTIHVVIRELSSPDFETLGGTRIDQRYKILLFITTRGTDYKNSYRTGLELMGDSFDEIYTNTGLQGNTDSLISFTASLDTKLDDDEVVCIHRLELEYMRRLNMLHR